MKKLNFSFILILLMFSIFFVISCKENKENIPATPEAERTTDSESMGDEAAGETEGENSNTGSGDTPMSGTMQSTRTGTNANSDFSGDGSDGSTSGTSVNKAKNVQTQNRSNADRNKSGYSAPDGTAAENRDGDMYTKHDTTRMPSGNVPIK